ncbi:MAG TPA: family 1 glycosylhydrolase [Anaerovoracaceae bacterium]|nr:family 1 glycosylhydrolase [Anaerovoracaceae bacterium]
MPFQPGFLWGAGSSAYQTEGAWNEDGKGASIWDEFCHTADNIKNEENGDDAAFTYRLFETDLTLIKKLGLNAYRFSVSWPRILPEGRGKVNLKGLCYYNRIVDSLLAAGVTPVITLYHWDLPLALEREGGWENRSTAEAFIEYAALIAHYFDGRVKRYITLNEPQCFLGLGYGSGLHAPGKRLSDQALVQCAHHALLAHGGATAAMRAASTSPLEIGLASTGNICFPASDMSDAKRAEHGAALPGQAGHDASSAEKAAYDVTFTLREDDWTFSHKWLLDAAVFGRYPEDLEAFRKLNDAVSDADLRMIREPMDFIGLNAYHGIPVDADGGRVKFPPGFPRTAMKWPVTPECMYYGPRFLYERYGLPVIVTENGCSGNDRIFPDGAVHDADRIDFLSRYLRQLKRAVKSGVPVNGYFQWSLTDNFEWNCGYDERFGLIYIDYETQKRVIKDSGYWYRDIITKNNDNP